MTDFVQVRSWHIARERAFDPTVTLCGLKVRSHPFPGEHQASGYALELPAGKSCEACLRIFARTPQDEDIGGGQE